MGNCFGGDDSSKPQGGGSQPTGGKDSGKGGDKKQEKHVKLLLIGAGESGKSTIFKQMRIIHNNKYSDKEIQVFKDAIMANMIHSMKVLVSAAKTLGKEISEDNKSAAQQLEDLDDMDILNASSLFNSELSDNLKKLWEISFNFMIQQNIFMDTLIELVNQVSVKTTGIVNIAYQVDDVKFQIFDVGGQRNERKKWMNVFDNVNSLVFVAALSEYDLTCYEDEKTMRLAESLKLFEDICFNKKFTDTPIILFFNKNDTFAEKIKKIDLKVFDEKYDGGCDYDNGLKYIKDKFLSQNPVEDRKIEVVICTSTETDTVKKVFEKIQNTVVQIVEINETIETKFICTPDQLDYNIHMNNSHYFTSMEFARTELLLRSKFWEKLVKKHCTLMIGGLSFQFRKQIHLFQVYKIVTKIIGCDEKWIFMEHILKTTDNKFIGKGLLRMGIVDKSSNKLVAAPEKMKEFLKEGIVDNFVLNVKSNQFIETFKSHDAHLRE
eukprot:gene1637-12762_t